MSDPFRLDGRTALVTGATRGLGAAIAATLVERGATVHGTARGTDDSRRIGERAGTQGHVLDVTDPAAIGRLAESLDVDLLVNNAGINIPASALETRVADWDAVLATNLRGAFLVSRAFGRRWIEAGTRAAVVNISSQAGTVAIEERVAYGASKAGIDQVTRVLALEWAAYGIRVNAVAPTFVHTELTASTLADPARAERLLARIPAGRFGEPEEVAGPVAFLLSDAASLITGHTLLVDGGYTIH